MRLFRVADAVDSSGESSRKAALEALIEDRLWQNWEEQPLESRKPKDEYAKEVRQRFAVALSTEMESDRDLLMIDGGEVPRAMHLTYLLLQYYEQEEQRAREAAACAFGTNSLDPAARTRCLAHLSGFSKWIQERWWLRLAPEAEQMSPEGSQSHASQTRAEHAVYCLQVEERQKRRMQMRDAVACNILQHYQHAMPQSVRDQAKSKLLELLEDNDAYENQVHAFRGNAEMVRTMKLASAANRAWKANSFLELVGALRPIKGGEAIRLGNSVAHWLQEMKDHAGRLSTLMEHRQQIADNADEQAWMDQVEQAANSIDAARRTVFQFALEYCGGTRGTVRRRGEH